MSNEKLTYHNIVKHEKRISYIFSFILPVILFVLIFFIITTIDVERGSSDTIGISLAVSFIYPLTYMLTYLPKRSGFKKTNSARPFFEKIGFEKMIIRDEMLHQFHKRYIEFFIWVVAFSVIMSLIIGALLEYSISEPLEEDSNKIYKMQLIFFSLPIVPGIMVYSFYSYKNPLRRYSDSNLYFSIGCFKILRNLADITEIENTHFVIRGLKYYDDYLWNNLKIRISNIEKFYTQLLLNLSLSDYTGIILSKLERGDRLDLLKYLTSLFKFNELNSISTSSASIKSMLPFITSVIASVISGFVVILFQYMLGNNS